MDDLSRPNDLHDVLRALERASGCSEMARVYTFVGSRENVDVAVRLLDHGPNASPRWVIEASDDRGRTATGNGDQTIRNTIATTHWKELARPLDG